MDAHVHFYDPSRPGGVPWPPANDRTLYRTVLPPDLWKQAAPLGVCSAIAVEASPLERDNDWLLAVVERDARIMGVVGHLKPGQPGFAGELSRLRRHPKFIGVRTGLWGVDLSLSDDVRADLQTLAQQGCTLDIGQGVSRLARVPELARALPDLRIVINHLGGPLIRVGEEPAAEWRQAVQAAANHRNVAMKISGFVEAVGRGTAGGRVVPDPDLVRPWFAAVLDAFGPERLIFATNWPVCEKHATYADVVGLVRELVSNLSETERASIWSGTAQAWYRYG